MAAECEIECRVLFVVAWSQVERGTKTSKKQQTQERCGSRMGNSTYNVDGCCIKREAYSARKEWRHAERPLGQDWSWNSTNDVVKKMPAKVCPQTMESDSKPCEFGILTNPAHERFRLLHSRLARQPRRPGLGSPRPTPDRARGSTETPESSLCFHWPHRSISERDDEAIVAVRPARTLKYP